MQSSGGGARRAGRAGGSLHDEPAEFRQVLLHTTKQHVERTWLQRFAVACGLGSASWAQGETPTNEISTSKYTVLTFIPINLFEQFSRVANLYFLLTACLQLIPGLSPTSWFTTVFPLVCVLLINAIKEGYDDFQRHKSDAEVNSRTVLVLTRGGQEVPTAWRDVQVGDVVKVKQDEEVPADLLFLSTSDELGVCHVETANLDGETNLKLKNCLQRTAHAHTADQLVDFEERLAVHCEMPTPRLYHFDGAVVDRLDPAAPHEPLTADNLLLRGCTLRKTVWVIGLVVSAGIDTKIMMNRTSSPRKITQLERHMNILVAIMFGWMLFLAIWLAAGDQIFMRTHQKEWYLKYEKEWPDLGLGFPGWIIQVIRFLILLNGVIPISLYVTLEMVKVLQCLFILNTDREMYYAETDTPFRCRTTTLNEDLGQVSYVLSDKTGTLTQNVMGFVWASFGGSLYGKRHTQKPPGHIPSKTPHSLLLDPALHDTLGPHFAALATAGPPSNSPLRPGSGAVAVAVPRLPRSPSGAGWAPVPISAAPAGVAGASSSPPAGAYPDTDAARFFINLAVCNTVIPQILEDGRFVYQASSPDEEALVQGAAYAGYRLEARFPDRVEVAYHGQRWSFKVLATLEFNSDRKRMSVVCRCPDNKVRLYCKGADMMVISRVRQGHPAIPTVRAHLEEMAQTGYRTLCVADKELTESQWETWSAQYRTASTALDNREQKMAAAAERLEQMLELVGATAVEDKLQDGVPEAIEALTAAGIRVWVLTGDKVETAISIALSCRLFTEDMAIIEIRERDFDSSLVPNSPRANGDGGAGPSGLGPNEESTHGDSSPLARPPGAYTLRHGTQNITLEKQVLAQKLEEVDAENLRLEYEAKMSRQQGAGSSSSNPSTPTQGQAGAGTKVGLVIEGGALAVALKTEHQDTLVALCSRAKSVVCCRVSPMQKAAVTKLVQAKCGAITLGIGDGANDVGMIQAAHIGVGISGREGRAAVLASDYSLAQFRFVARLILVHGRAAAKRNAEVVLYSFYKNWVNNLTYVCFAFVTAFSAQPLYTSGLIATFNLFWTSLPIIAYALFEQDVSHAMVLRFPSLYSETMTYSRRDFLLSQLQWLGLATWHSLVVWFIPMYSMSVPDVAGLADDWVAIGVTVYTATVITCNLKLGLRTRYWTWVNHLVVWASILLWLPFIWLYGLVWPVAKIDGTADMSSIAKRVFASPRYWLGGVLLAPTLSLLLDLAVSSFRRHMKPKPFELVQELEYEEDLRKEALKRLGVRTTKPTAADATMAAAMAAAAQDGFLKPPAMQLTSLNA